MRSIDFKLQDVFAPKLLQTLRNYSRAQLAQDALAGVNDHVHKQLMQGGIEQQMDPHNICANIHFALRRAADLLKPHPTSPWRGGELPGKVESRKSKVESRKTNNINPKFLTLW